MKTPATIDAHSSPCARLHGRMRDICEGTASGVSRRQRSKYLDLWIDDGTLSADPRDETSASQATVEVRPTTPARSLPCVHRGEQVRTVYCKPCQSPTGGGADVPVFACALHGECTARKTGHALRGCSVCGDHQVPETEPIRLLWLSSDLSQGGVSRYFATVISGLQETIRSVAIGFSTIHPKTTDFGLIRRFQRSGIRIVCTDLDAPEALRRRNPEIEFRGPDVYDELIEQADVVTTAVNNPHVLHRSDWRGRPIVAQLHSTCDETTRIARLMAPHATLFTVTSDESRRNAVEKIKLPSERVRVIELAADLNRVTTWREPAEVRRELLAAGEHYIEPRIGPMDAKWLVYFGRFSPEKRLPEIAQAVRILNEHETWIGVFVGDGWYADKTRPLIRQAIGHRFLFAPWTQRIGDVLAAADVVVCNSEYEGGPTTSIEALLAGVPLVSTDVGILQTAPGSYWSTGRQPTPETIAAAVLRASEGRRPMERLPEDLARAHHYRGRFGVRRMADQFADAVREAANQLSEVRGAR